MFLGVMKQLIQKCIDGASSMDLCKFGDAQIVKETSTVFKKEKEMLKGMLAIMFCCLCHIIYLYIIYFALCFRCGIPNIYLCERVCLPLFAIGIWNKNYYVENWRCCKNVCFFIPSAVYYIYPTYEGSNVLHQSTPIQKGDF